MLLRHLIALIIDARNIPAALVRRFRRRAERSPHRELMRQYDRSDHKNQNSRAAADLPRVDGVEQSDAHLLTMSKDPAAARLEDGSSQTLLFATRRMTVRRDGGADRDRTDDLKLAKLPLSQLSYGPVTTSWSWWARVDSNYRPHAYQACALTT